MSVSVYPEPPAELLTVREVARLCHVHEVTVRRHILQGRLKAVRIGKAVRIRREDYERYIEIYPSSLEAIRGQHAGNVITADDAIFRIVGIAHAGGGLAENKKAAFAEAFLPKQ